MGVFVSEFKREDRFIVLKRKDLEALNHFQKAALAVALEKIQNHLPARQYVVVESDWPEYEFVWEMIQARVEGKPNRITALEADNAKLRAVAEAARLLSNNHSPLDPYVYELNKALRAAGYGGKQ